MIPPRRRDRKASDDVVQSILELAADGRRHLRSPRFISFANRSAKRPCPRRGLMRRRNSVSADERCDVRAV